MKQIQKPKELSSAELQEIMNSKKKATLGKLTKENLDQ